MTIASQTSRISYVGDGVTTAFSVPFYFSANADLVVYLQDTLGNQTLQVLDTHYNLTGATLSAGGTCTFVTAPTATTGAVVTIYRDPPATQTTSYNNNDPFPAKSHELALDKLTTLVQRCKDLVMRAIHQSEGEAAMTTALATPAVRKNKLFGFGSSGELIYPLGPTFVAGTFNGVAEVDSRATAQVTTFPISINAVKTSGYATAGDGGGATYVRGSGGGSFTDGGAVSWVPFFADNIVNAKAFGIKDDGTTDNSAKWATWLTAAVGKTAYLPVPATGYKTTTTLSIPAGTTLVGGAGTRANPATILGIGKTARPIMTFAEKSGVTIRGIKFQGDCSTVLADGGTIGAIGFSCNTIATSDLTIEECVFQGFNDSYTIQGAISGNTAYSRITIRNNSFVSDGTSYINNVGFGHPGIICMFGNDTNAGGSFNDLRIANNSIVASGTNIGVGLYNNMLDVVVDGNLITGAGTFDTTILNNYAILVYDNAGTLPATNVRLTNNILLDNTACGIYMATAAHGVISGNIVARQTRTDDGTLPRAGIALNDPRGFLVEGNYLYDCWGGIAFVGMTGSFRNAARGNHIYSGTSSPSPYGFRIDGPASGTSNVIISDNDVEILVSTAIGLRGSAPIGLPFNYLEISGNTFKCGGRSVSLSGAYATKAIVIRDNVYCGSDITAALDVGSVSGFLSVSGEVFDLTNISGNGMIADGSTKVAISNITFANKSSGSVAYSGIGAQGNLDGIKFLNVAAASQMAATSLGYSIPTWSGLANYYVQNLGTSAYTAAGGFLNKGWTCQATTTWNANKVTV